MIDLFVFAGTNWAKPVPESGTKILTVYLGSFRVSDIRDFVCSLYPKAILFDFCFTHLQCIASSPIGIAYDNIISYRHIILPIVRK